MAEKYHKPDGELVKTPVEEICGNPNSHKSSQAGMYDRTPGLPERTTGKNSIPEKFYDKIGNEPIQG